MIGYGNDQANFERSYGLLKKVVVWTGITFAVFFVAFRPGAAADVVRTLGETVTEIFRGVGDFFGGPVG
jgi:hypothetical protein